MKSLQLDTKGDPNGAMLVLLDICSGQVCVAAISDICQGTTISADSCGIKYSYHTMSHKIPPRIINRVFK